MAGQYHLPDAVPDIKASQVAGIRVRRFTADGLPEDGDLFVPSNQTSRVSAPFVVAFDPEGRVAVVASRSAAPVTPGSLTTGVAEPISVIRADYGASDAPALESDVDMLRFLVPSAGLNPVEGKIKQVRLASPGRSTPVSIAIVPEAQPVSPQLQFAASERATTPAEIVIALTGTSASFGTVAVFAAPGLRGGLRILPLRKESAVAFFVTSLDGRLEVPASSSGPVSVRMHLSAQAFTLNNAIEVSIPYDARTTAPWLKIDNAIGVTPADLILTADPSGLLPGDYQGALTFDDRLPNSSVPFTVGPVFRLAGFPLGPPPALTIGRPDGPPVDFPIRLTSSSTPLNFRITPLDAFLDVNPQSGVTPADLVLTVDPSKARGQFTRFSIEGPNTGNFYSIRLAQSISPATPFFTVSTIISPLSPGALVPVSAIGQPCAAAEAPVPWPFELGGCSLRVNGVALPIGAITVSTTITASGTANGFFTFATLLTQLPYDLEGPYAGFELISAFPRASQGIRVVAAGPTLILYDTPAFPRSWLTRADGSISDRNNPVRVGEVVSLRISGYGRTEPAAPIGALPPEDATIRPVARMEAFIDARPAEVVSAELSKSEVGVAVVRVRIPDIQADDHLFVLRVAGVETVPAPVRIVR